MHEVKPSLQSSHKPEGLKTTCRNYYYYWKYETFQPSHGGSKEGNQPALLFAQSLIDM